MGQTRTVFILLSFEGPDRYSHAGGLGSRTRELSAALASMGHETHLFFIGDPALPGVEERESGLLTLHRWCQWISKYHPGGAYDGEAGKVADWSSSLPRWLEQELIAAHVQAGNNVVVLAEEWQTVGSVIALRDVISRRGWGQCVQIFWNMNNAFGADRIDWPALKRSAVVTTVSRYMKHFMWRFGVDARVIPNGISESWGGPADEIAVASLSRLMDRRAALVKIARWDPDKRWNMAVDAVATMKRRGLRPLLIARGGVEQHGDEVLARAAAQGLELAAVSWDGERPEEMIAAIKPAVTADVINLRGYLNQPQLKVLYRAADSVLANSGVEPFGLVGLEVMASGGLAFVGSTGEDYATAGYDCISIQTDSPAEVAYHAEYLKAAPAVSRSIRHFARQTAKRYTWPAVIERVLISLIGEVRGIGPTSQLLQPGSAEELLEPDRSPAHLPDYPANSPAVKRLPAARTDQSRTGEAQLAAV